MRRKRMRDLLEKAEMSQIWIQNWILLSNRFFTLRFSCSVCESKMITRFASLFRRPETSFFWFTNPCKTCKFIVWRRFKWLFIGLVVLILVLLFLGILLYSLPVRTHLRLYTWDVMSTMLIHLLFVFFRTTFPWKSSNPSIKFKEEFNFLSFYPCS